MTDTGLALTGVVVLVVGVGMVRAFRQQSRIDAVHDERRAQLTAETSTIRQGALNTIRMLDEVTVMTRDLIASEAALRALLAELVDPDPCAYDHHGLCQAHSSRPRPCPHERAKALLPPPSPLPGAA